MRTIIIGDVHGCFKEFAELLEKCEIGSEDRLILLGDLMNRGPKSREVFEKVCEMKASMGDRFCLVRGNHEEILLDAVLDQNESLWKSNGGMKTKSSFGPEKQKLIECADWIKVNMPYYQEFESALLLCTYHIYLKTVPLAWTCQADIQEDARNCVGLSAKPYIRYHDFYLCCIQSEILFQPVYHIL